jgi:hypothetical protein
MARRVAAVAVALVVANAVPAHGASGWSVIASAKLTQTGQSYFDAVSCAPAPARVMPMCIAVGSRVTLQGVTRPLVERWTGRGWKTVTIPVKAGAIASSFVAVSCPSPKSCVAVGNSRAGASSPSVPLIARWNGGRWSLVTGPRPPGSTGTYLNAVSCSSAKVCVAVGSYTSRQTSGAPLALRSNGGKWALATLPRPSKAASTTLTGVSCIGAVCWAVGSYALRPEGTPYYTVIERLVSGKWTLVKSPNFHKSHDSAFTSVSCASAKSCLAAGYWGHGAGATFGARWNGKAWSEVRTLNPRGFTFSHLAAISCAVAGRCVAAGTYSMGAKSLTLVEQWNGHAWQIQPSPQPSKSASSALMGVSCTTATRCLAVGTYLTNKFGNPSAGFSQHRS